MPSLTIQQLFQQALQHHQAGQLQQAEQIYRQILAQQPDHADAMHCLAVMAHQAGHNDIAIDLIRRVIALQPDRPQAYFNLGNALHSAQKFDEAIIAYRWAVTLSPDFPDAHYNLGNALNITQQFDEAIAAYHRAIALRPDFPESHFNLGNALSSNRQFDQAIAAYRQAIALRPDFFQVHNNLGNALVICHRFDEAVSAYRQAIAMRPDSFEGHNNLGNALREAGSLDEAIAACRQAIALCPSSAKAHDNIGNALRDKGRLDEAIAAYRHAIALNSGYYEAHNNLGIVLNDAGFPDEAIAAHRQAIQLMPNQAESHNNLADALKAKGEIAGAIIEFRHAMALNPNSPVIHSNFLYALHFHPDYNTRSIAEESQSWKRRHAEPLRKLIRPHTNHRNPDRRLRIGHVSPDFREHPVGRFLIPLLSHHDKSQVEIFGYAQVLTPDATSQRLRSHTNSWQSIVGHSDAAVIELIRRDQIDILIDLTMHMAGNRLLVFAAKPAPVQVTYLAYCSTTGLDTIDYRLSDPYLDPPGMNESVYSEQTIRLPDTYWCYPSINDSPQVNRLPALTHNTITFGCLNNFCKISQPTLATWTKLLRAIPNSQLLLSAPEGTHRQRVHDQLQRDGVEPMRVRFVGKMPLLDYFRLYHKIDIALDTFPYAGGTTTCDALWMGVPTVSLCGQTAVGRGGLSILSNIGLPELIAHSEEEYVQIAIKLANDVPQLSQLRSTLRQRMEHSSLMDAPKFARNIEAAYRQMWHTWCQTSSVKS